MIIGAIVRRRLREGKTYEDFRRAWFHDRGFGMKNQMLTMVNAADPREIIVIALTNVDSEEQARAFHEIEDEQRGSSPLDEVIESPIHRTLGVLVADDDFSASGNLSYVPPAVDGVTTNFDAVDSALQLVAGTLEAGHIRRGDAS